MKKFLLTILACLAVVVAQAFPKALYVVIGDEVHRYNFGVAADLTFSDNGTKLHISGYSEVIDLTKVDYISLSAPNMPTITPTEQKQKMVDIVDRFYRKFNIRDYEETIFMIDHYIQNYEELSFDADRFFNLHDNSSRPLPKFMNAIREIARGNVGYAPAVRSSVELWQASDFFGEFVPDNSGNKWIKASPSSDHLEFRFPAPGGAVYSVKAVPSKEYTDWTELDFTGRVPRTITVTGAKDSRVLFTVVIENVINDQEKAIESTVTATVENLVAATKLAITDKKITELTTVALNGETLVTVSADIYGRDFTNYEKWRDDYNNMEDEYYDSSTGYWEDGDDFASDVIAPRVYFGKAEADIMGELQVKGHISQLKKLLDILDEDSYIGSHEEWDYNKNTCYFYDEDISSVERKAMYVNTYSDVAFFYDGTSAMQGYFSWDVNVDDDDSYYSDGYWDDNGNWIAYPHTYTYVYYELMPLLTFPDLTTFAVEDFFNRTDFNRLVNDYDRILDDYFRIVGRKRP